MISRDSKQERSPETPEPFKPRRRLGRPGTHRFSGFTLTPDAIRTIKARAAALNITPNWLITDIVEEWARKQARGAPRRSRKT